MRSQELDLSKYNTDKIDNKYLETYDPILEPFLDKEIKLLEVGVLKGGSVLLWRDYFPKAQIAGVDIKISKDFKTTDRIKLFEGSQTDKKFLSNVARETAPEGYDIIIDDASHYGSLTKKTFEILFDNHLKPGGLYVIEDWGTGFWDDWPDGQIYSNPNILKEIFLKILVKFKIIKSVPFHNHSFGLVGFIKQLVDEQGAADISRGSFKNQPTKHSKFKKISIFSSIVVIQKN